MHRRMASLAYVTTLTYPSTDDQWALPARSLVSSLKTERSQISSVTSLVS